VRAGLDGRVVAYPRKQTTAHGVRVTLLDSVRPVAEQDAITADLAADARSRRPEPHSRGAWSMANRAGGRFAGGEREV
jgi:hypothetical protein